MKQNTHPDYREVVFTCQCGQQHSTRSTINSVKTKLDTCSNCYPFKTGKQFVSRRKSQVNKFQQRYAFIS